MLTYPQKLNTSISLFLLLYVINIHLGCQKILFLRPNDDLSDDGRGITGVQFATIPLKIA